MATQGGEWSDAARSQRRKYSFITPADQPAAFMSLSIRGIRRGRSVQSPSANLVFSQNIAGALEGWYSDNGRWQWTMPGLIRATGSIGSIRAWFAASFSPAAVARTRRRWLMPRVYSAAAASGGSRVFMNSIR
jgi:hypothetical protein